MALYSVTLNRLRQAVKLAIAQDVDEQLNPLADVVNEAISAFTLLHPWQWREAALSLSTVASQAYVNLPSDFGQLMTLRYSAPGNSNGTLVAKPLADIVAMRTTLPSSALNTPTYFYAVAWVAQASVTALPQPRLELYPTPSASTTAAMIGYYKKDTPKLVNGTDVPDMPASFHPALLNFCAVYACQSFGCKDIKLLKERTQLLETQIENLKAQDGLDQWAGLGRMEGVGTGETEFVESDPIIIPS